MPSFKFRKIFVLLIWGKKGVKKGFFKVFSKSIRMIWFHLLGKIDIIILHMYAKLQVQTLFRSRDRGSNGGSKRVKNGFFVVFSKVVLTIWFHLLRKEDIIILHIRVKFRVQAIFLSRDIMSNGGQNGSKMGFSWFSHK